jgi:hypothetical protein
MSVLPSYLEELNNRIILLYKRIVALETSISKISFKESGLSDDKPIFFSNNKNEFETGNLDSNLDNAVSLSIMDYKLNPMRKRK